MECCLDKNKLSVDVLVNQLKEKISELMDSTTARLLKQDGKIAEMGNHEDLLKKEGSYYKLYQSQFAGNKT